MKNFECENLKQTPINNQKTKEENFIELPTEKQLLGKKIPADNDQQPKEETEEKEEKSYNSEEEEGLLSFQRKTFKAFRPKAKN